MARIMKPPPGKLIVSFIYSSIDALADSLKKIERQFGSVEFETLDIDCADKLRYSEEMGLSLQRRFFSFERPVNRDSLVTLKKTAAKIEPDFADQVGDHLFRTVNIDPGILSPENLIMTSCRAANHRVYFRDGVYADLQLVWSREQYVQLPWTNQDFCHNEVIDLLTRVRSTFDLVESEPQKSLS